jgi:hypothetical protein
MNRRGARAKKFLTMGSLLLLLTAGASAVLMGMCVSPRASFKRFVIRPIPQSVRNIKADRCQISTLQDRFDGYQEHAVVLRFEIRREDLFRIVAARRFKAWDSLKDALWCCEGKIQFDHPESHATRRGIELYTPERQAPSWFDLDADNWSHCDAYVQGQYDEFRGWADASFLFYNEELGSAYLLSPA